MAAEEECCKPMFFVYLLICVGLVAFAGLMSGLTLGLMSLSLVDLEVLVKAGTPKDRSNAEKILPVVRNQHLLLCTLLIGNSLAMEALPIFLDALVPAWGAVLISVTLILSFGEIIPQAVCTRYGLRVGAKMAGVVRILLLLFFPITYPISKLLDWLLGKGHFVLLRRAELKTLVDMHGNEAGKGGELTHDETTIIAGALELTRKTAKDAMTTISETFSLDINSILDMNTMGLIMNKGHSRVPIYSGEPSNIVGLILVKNLITCRAEDGIPIRHVTIRKIPRVHEDMPLYDILNEFQKGHSHMAVVVKHTKDPGANAEADKTEKGKNNSGDGSLIIDVATDTTSVATSIPGNPSSLGSLDQHGDARRPHKKWERGWHENILDDLDSLPSYPVHEEVVGIITMEDVIEELLQEEILDETDEYVDVHNKIKINMLPSKQSLSPRSPGHVPRFPRRNPMAPPHNHVSSAHSPVSPGARTPSLTPTAFRARGKSLSTLPENSGDSSSSAIWNGALGDDTMESISKGASKHLNEGFPP